MANKYDSDLIMSLARSLIAGNKTPGQYAADKAGISQILTDDGKFAGFNWGELNPSNAQMNAVDTNFNKMKNIQDISDGVSLKQLGQLGMGAASAHPFKTAGLIGLGAGNIGGLTDNDKFGGQLGGLALGGLGSYLMGANPYTAALLTLGGGELGSLYDKLRAKKEAEQAYYGR